MSKLSLSCYICLLLVVSLFTGCSVNAVSKQTETSDTECDRSTTEEIIASSEVTDLGSETESESYLEINGDDIAGYLYWDYFSFEEGINRAHYVVEARCIETYSDKLHTYAVFETLINIKGEVKEESFILRANRRALVYVDDLYKYMEDYSRQYSVGEEYLLVMNRYISVYNEYDYYTLIGGIHIPKDALEESYMFGYGPLSETAENKDCLNAGYDNFISYVKGLVKENPTGTEDNGTDYIRSEKLEDIVGETKTILKIKMGFHHVVGMDSDREFCYCTVVDVLKGTATKEEVQILFPAGIAVTDDEYLVMLYSRIEDSGYYTMSSKNSVYRWDDTEKVEKIIELIEQSE